MKRLIGKFFVWIHWRGPISSPLYYYRWAEDRWCGIMFKKVFPYFRLRLHLGGDRDVFDKLFSYGVD